MYDFHLKMFEIMPEWVVLWIYPLVTLSVMAALSLLFRKFITTESLYDNDTDVVDTATQNTLSAAYVIMGFTLVLVMGSADTYETNVMNEGTNIESLDRMLMLDGSPQALAMRKDLIQYSTSIVNDEWPKLRNGGNASTENLMQQLSKNLLQFKPQTEKQIALYTEIVRKTDLVILSREIRLLNASGGLPTLFWTISYLYLFGVAIICALRLSHATPMRFVALSIQVTMLSLIFSAVMIIDHPYTGQTKVSAAPIIQAIESMKKL
ncbi:DUF4239 domain-containing protein [Zwartia vadi]|uniref:bestrophin-like domain n=1 Tax=Zwartia vadi TaxID=3058168 RepID=UPI0025B4E9AA|nr:DUF4239 domain-containing protein [Zwartia vadi]MDN3986552.1 DUF4239 domain-containing protein [Zwartia vadi]